MKNCFKKCVKTKKAKGDFYDIPLDCHISLCTVGLPLPNVKNVKEAKETRKYHKLKLTQEQIEVFKWLNKQGYNFSVEEETMDEYAEI